MGGVESKFGSHLVEGKESEALEIWNANFDLQANFQPNAQIKTSPQRDTPLHCAVRSEMKELMVEFLSNGGDPFTTNGIGETSLHIVCRGGAKSSSRRSRKRAEFLQLMLERIPSEENFEVIQSSGSTEVNRDSVRLKFPALSEDKGRANGGPAMGKVPMAEPAVKTTMDGDAHYLGAQDKSRNTPLHLAAASGFLECVELLVAHNAPLFAHNIAGQTPCDVAWEAKQIIIAKQLESKMVLDSDMLPGKSEAAPIKPAKNKSFHNTEALKTLKEEIIADIALKLEVDNYAARALLMTYGWSRELLVDAWNDNKEEVCEKAGLVFSGGKVKQSHGALYAEELECGICYTEIQPERTVDIPCKHVFCEECWRSYIENQIEEGAGKEIRCPDTGCFTIVPDGLIAKLVSEGQMERYTDLNLKQFVASSADIRWCPFPDCGYAICTNREEKEVDVPVGGASRLVTGGRASSEALLTAGENVECGQGHGFCWKCSMDPHEPCSCELWCKWKDVVISNMSEEDRARIAGEAQANAQWIMKNTKPCPNCKSPIQKDEGCNHMTCKTCKHDFCWVCLDPWNVHSHRTGGYFTCNRWSAQAKADKVVKKMQSTLEQDYVGKARRDLEQQQQKFEHYHERYNNHLQSLDIETKLLQDSKAKLREMERLGQALDKKVALVRAKVLMDTVEFADEACRSFPNLKGKNFLDDVFRALLHSRRILAASYCIGYFLPEEKRAERTAHESIQGKLEGAVETLSQMVNREYLLATQQKLIMAAKNVQVLCEEYLLSMHKVAEVAGMCVMGIESEEERRAREERERQRTEEDNERPTLEELLFFQHLIRLMDGGDGRVHILLPPTTNGQ